MTSYLLEVGYNSSFGREEAEEKLKIAVDKLRNDPDRLIAEVRRLDGDLEPDCDVPFAEYARLYSSDEDLTIRHDGEHRYIQMASGGGIGRSIKEAFRRAFCRLILEDMHREGVEINIGVY